MDAEKSSCEAGRIKFEQAPVLLKAFQYSTFDVFDTLVTRKCGGPDSLLYFTGRALAERHLVQLEPAGFVEQRKLAEARCYGGVQGPGTKLIDIYRELAEAEVIDVSRIHDAAAVEAEMEMAELVAIPHVSDLVAARRRESRIAYLSDTYLSQEEIEFILDQAQLRNGNEEVWASSRRGAWKEDGSLFRRFVEDCGAAAGTILHHGNNPHADCLMAQRAGLASRAIDGGNLNRFERVLDEFRSGSMGLGPRLAGASRMARLSQAQGASEEQARLRIACSVAGPCLVAFIMWVLRDASERGLTRLYFLSRDGFILKQIAEILAPKLAIGIEMRYLYASRQAWSKPSMITGDIGEIAWVKRAAEKLSLDELLEILGMDNPQERTALIQATGHAPSTLGVANADFTVAGEQVLRSPAVRDRLVVISAKERLLVESYLRQEGLLENGTWALVDLGWSGSLQKSLNRILAPCGTSVEGYYFGLRPDALNEQAGEMRSFFGRVGKGTTASELPLRFLIFIEGFCFAPHGSVTGYSESEGNISARFSDSDPGPLHAWGLERFHSGITAVAEAIEISRNAPEFRGDVRAKLVESLEMLQSSPSREEAECWCGLPWEDGVGSCPQFLRLGQALTWLDIIAETIRPRSTGRNRAWWFVGSLAMSPPEVQLGYRILRKFRSSLGSFIFKRNRI